MCPFHFRYTIFSFLSFYFSIFLLSPFKLHLFWAMFFFFSHSIRHFTNGFFLSPLMSFIWDILFIVFLNWLSSLSYSFPDTILTHPFGVFLDPFSDWIRPQKWARRKLNLIPFSYVWMHFQSFSCLHLAFSHSLLRFWYLSICSTGIFPVCFEYNENDTFN